MTLSRRNEVHSDSRPNYGESVALKDPTPEGTDDPVSSNITLDERSREHLSMARRPKTQRPLKFILSKGPDAHRAEQNSLSPQHRQPFPALHRGTGSKDHWQRKPSLTTLQQENIKRIPPCASHTATQQNFVLNRLKGQSRHHTARRHVMAPTYAQVSQHPSKDR